MWSQGFSHWLRAWKSSYSLSLPLQKNVKLNFFFFFKLYFFTLQVLRKFVSDKQPGVYPSDIHMNTTPLSTLQLFTQKLPVAQQQGVASFWRRHLNILNVLNVLRSPGPLCRKDYWFPIWGVVFCCQFQWAWRWEQWRKDKDAKDFLMNNQ